MIKKIHCPFCGRMMDSDIHSKELGNTQYMDNWTCVECLNGDTIVIGVDELIGMIAEPSNFKSKIKNYYGIK
jgi:hypothetical protein